MTTFAVTDPAHTIGAINYLLSNLNAGSGTGNVVLPGNVLVANTTTGVVSQSGNTADVSYYLYQWVNLRYSNNATGGGGSFSTTPTNLDYFGVFNSTTQAPSSNPTDYQWYEVAGGFGTTKILYYSAIGGRQIQWVAANSAPSSNYVASVANVAIDLDVVTTAAGTPGERGPIAMAYVVTTADPNTATTSQLTSWFEAPRDASTPPIGTGLAPPVVGDTAQFTYVNGTTNPTACYTFNGSIWVPVDGQVVSGNVIIDGTLAANSIIAGSITSTQIAADSIYGNRIAANTVTATNIQANTITGNNIAGNTITAINIVTGTITSTQIAADTITGNNIAAGTITTNNFTANTINGNVISAGTITAEQLAANAIIANTVVSTGATLGSNTSPGFWLDGTTGNARFGNSLSVGNLLSVGSNAVIGTNLIVGANASIGGNLAVTGLVTSGALNPNTVSTGTILTGAVSTFTSYQLNGSGSFAPSLTSGTWTTFPAAAASAGLTLTTIQTNQTVFLWENAWYTVQLNNSGGASTSATIGARLVRWSYPSLNNLTVLQDWTYTVTVAPGPSPTYAISPTTTQLVDSIPTVGTWQYAWQMYWQSSSPNISGLGFTIKQTGATPNEVPLTFLALALKR